MVVLINKIQFRDPIMGPYLSISKDKAVYSNAYIQLQCDRISGNKQYSLEVVYIHITWKCNFASPKICQALAVFKNF